MKNREITIEHNTEAATRLTIDDPVRIHVNGVQIYDSNGPQFPLSEKEVLEERLKKAGVEIRKAVADWHRFHDFIVGEGPQEFFRLRESLERNKGSVIESLLGYLSNLWNERNQLSKENCEMRARGLGEGLAK